MSSHCFPKAVDLWFSVTAENHLCRSAHRCVQVAVSLPYLFQNKLKWCHWQIKSGNTRMTFPGPLDHQQSPVLQSINILHSILTSYQELSFVFYFLISSCQLILLCLWQQLLCQWIFMAAASVEEQCINLIVPSWTWIHRGNPIQHNPRQYNPFLPVCLLCPHRTNLEMCHEKHRYAIPALPFI